MSRRAPAPRFARLDANRDGTVTTAEAEAVRATARARAMERSKGALDRHFARLDADGNGQISRAEFDAGHGGMASRRGSAATAARVPSITPWSRAQPDRA
jgi:hypothetical protein